MQYIPLVPHFFSCAAEQPQVQKITFFPPFNPPPPSPCVNNIGQEKTYTAQADNMFNGNIIESFFFSSLSFSLISLSHPLFLFLCCLSDPSLRLSLLLMILLLNISKILKTQFKQYKRSLSIPTKHCRSSLSIQKHFKFNLYSFVQYCKLSKAQIGIILEWLTVQRNELKKSIVYGFISGHLCDYFSGTKITHPQ